MSILLHLISLVFAASNVMEVKTTQSTSIPVKRWIYDETEKPPAKKYLKQLRLLKKSQNIGNYKSCYETAGQLKSIVPQIKIWLLKYQIECLLQLTENRKSFKRRARNILALARKNHELDEYPYVDSVRPLVAELRRQLFLVEIKTNDSKVHQSFSRLVGVRRRLDEKKFASILKQYGNFLLAKQNIKGALSLLEQSFSIDPSDELLGKIDRLRKKMKKPAEFKEPERKIFLTDEETQLLENFEQAINAEDYMAAVEDGVVLLKKFPGSHNSETVFQALRELFVKIHFEEKLKSQAERLLDNMRSVPARYQARWAKHFYRRTMYRPAQILYRAALETIAESEKADEYRYYQARALQFLGEYEPALEEFDKIIRTAAGTDWSVRALFYSGLTAIRAGHYTDAISRFERLFQTHNSERYDVSTSYWLWRLLLLKNQSDQAEIYRKNLITRFPYTYYALIAKAYKADGIIEIKVPKEKKFKAAWHLAKPYHKHFRRAELLLRAGFLSEARFELGQLPEPTRKEDQVALARYWAAALDYRKAIRLVKSVWDENREFRALNIFRIGFPNEFNDEIKVHAQIYSLSPELLRGVVRQESAFFVKAKSSAGALGLMQITPPTATDIGKSLAVKNLKLPGDMYLPILNIRFGTYYLAKMIRKYSGHIGLGLAAYNAGPTRLDRFLNSRTMQSKTMAESQDPMSEIWIDELPWSETAKYVKSILRNVIVYRSLNEGPTELKPPFWRTASLGKEKAEEEMSNATDSKEKRDD